MGKIFMMLLQNVQLFFRHRKNKNGALKITELSPALALAFQGINRELNIFVNIYTSPF